MNSDPISPESPTPVKSKKTWVIVLIVIILLCCLCAVGIASGAAAYYFFQNYEVNLNGDNVNPDAQSQAAPTRPVATSPKPAKTAQIPDQKPTVQLPNPPTTTSGEEVRLEKCGYSFKKAADLKYIYKGEGCSPSMMVPGSDEVVPPSILFTTVIGSNAQSQYDSQVEYLGKTPGYTINSKEQIKIGGLDGTMWDLDIKQGKLALKSQMVLVMVTPDQYFQIYGIAAADKWENLRPYFEAARDSVTFFKPN